ncbi:MAG TPA: hypothetical protein VKA00_08620 [Trueperaceae bacterium]|nr:hypothetical protein [Trueperaceae bacterium]
MGKPFVVALAFLALISGVYASEIGVSPSRVDLQATPGSTVTESIDLISNSTTTEHVTVHVSDWTLSPTGKLQFLSNGSAEYSSRSWLQPEAMALDLPPNSTVPFRFSLEVPSDSALDGTYHAMLVFDIGAAAPALNGKVQMSVTTAIGVAVYVSISGTERPKAQLSDMYLGDNGALAVVLSNEGNTLVRITGAIEFRDRDGKTLATQSVDDIPVLRGSQREVDVPVPKSLTSGYYVALALLHDRQGATLSGQLPIQVP